MLSERAGEVKVALDANVAEFWHREGRDPSKLEREAMEREASADTRHHKTGQPGRDLRARWVAEAAGVGVTPDTLSASIAAARRSA